MVLDDFTFGLISGLIVIFSTFIVILFTRRVANRLQQQAEKRKSLEKERSELLLQVKNLEDVLSEKDSELERLKKEIAEQKEREQKIRKDEEAFLTLLNQRLDTLNEKVESLSKETEKLRRERERKGV